MPVVELYVESFRTKRLKVFLLEMSRLASACTGPKLQNHARCRGESAVSLAADVLERPTTAAWTAATPSVRQAAMVWSEELEGSETKRPDPLGAHRHQR